MCIGMHGSMIRCLVMWERCDDTPIDAAGASPPSKGCVTRSSPSLSPPDPLTRILLRPVQISMQLDRLYIGQGPFIELPWTTRITSSASLVQYVIHKPRKTICQLVLAPLVDHDEVTACYLSSSVTPILGRFEAMGDCRSFHLPCPDYSRTPLDHPGGPISSVAAR